MSSLAPSCSKCGQPGMAWVTHICPPPQSDSWAPSSTPVMGSDPSADEHAAISWEWVRESQAAVDQGVKTEQEHARTVRAVLEDALTFLERFGGTRPPRTAA